MTKLIVGVVLSLLVAFDRVQAQSPTSSQTVLDVANIAQPITLTNATGLSFGTVISGSTQRTVTVSGLGVLSGATNVIYTGSGRTTVSAAGFYVTGEPGYHYAITKPSTCTVSHGTATMTVALSAPIATTVSGHAASGGLNTAGTSSAISSSGVNAGYDAWAIGGTLTIGANQVQGLYTGSFTVTVQYQ